MTTPNLSLPEIAASQAQKHVTHNEALNMLDAMVQLSAIDRDLTAPPVSPADGDRYIPAPGATGAWLTWDLSIAAWQDGAWVRYQPREGWTCWVMDEDVLLAWNGSVWQNPSTAGAISFKDSLFTLEDDADSSKKANFQLSGITTATTRTYTLPNVTGALATLGALTQSFAGSTTFANAVNSLGTSTAASTTNVGTGATAAAATKTVNVGTGGISTSITNINLGSALAGALGTFTVNSTTITYSQATGIAAAAANVSYKWLGLGGATADATNRLSINTPSVLFNHDGAEINVTLNKSAAGNDARFTFQNGFSTRALFGLLANDDFGLKVSPDGAVFSNALIIENDTARATGRKGGVVPAVQVSVLTANFAGADVATPQPVFPAAQDAITLEAATTYAFEAEYAISRAAGTTSHTTGVLFGGTAALTSIGYMAQVTNPTGNVVASVQQLWGAAATLLTLTAANVVATENLNILLKGTVRVNAAGSLIPQFQFSAAPGGVPTVKQNTSFRIWPLGINTLTSAGQWA